MHGGGSSGMSLPYVLISLHLCLCNILSAQFVNFASVVPFDVNACCMQDRAT